MRIMIIYEFQTSYKNYFQKEMPNISENKITNSNDL